MPEYDLSGLVDQARAHMDAAGPLPPEPATLTAATDIREHCMAALGAGLSQQTADQVEVVFEHLVSTHGRLGVDLAAGLLCSLANGFINHRHQPPGTNVIHAVDEIDASPSNWEQHAVLATELLAASANDNDEKRLITALNAIAGEPSLPVLILLVHHLNNLVQAAYDVEGRATEAWERVRPKPDPTGGT